ncbi:MAG: hypothetical protein AB7D57_14505, partial [Desulfovibrionaceae bacterium]
MHKSCGRAAGGVRGWLRAQQDRLEHLGPSDEKEFLPAALEIVETPPSPIGRAMLWTIMAVVVLGILWACLGKTDVVAVGQGKIIPSGRVKVIQPLENGVVRRILAQEGQHVAEGELLVELDTTVTGADVERLGSELATARLDHARLQALLSWDGVSEAAPTMELPERADPAAFLLQKRQMESQFSALCSTLRYLDTEIQRLEAQVAATQHAI